MQDRQILIDGNMCIVTLPPDGDEMFHGIIEVRRGDDLRVQLVKFEDPDTDNTWEEILVDPQYDVVRQLIETERAFYVEDEFVAQYNKLISLHDDAAEEFLDGFGLYFDDVDNSVSTFHLWVLKSFAIVARICEVIVVEETKRKLYGIVLFGFSKMGDGLGIVSAENAKEALTKWFNSPNAFTKFEAHVSDVEMFRQYWIRLLDNGECGIAGYKDWYGYIEDAFSLSNLRDSKYRWFVSWNAIHVESILDTIKGFVGRTSVEDVRPK